MCSRRDGVWWPDQLAPEMCWRGVPEEAAAAVNEDFPTTFNPWQQVPDGSIVDAYTAQLPIGEGSGLVAAVLAGACLLGLPASQHMRLGFPGAPGCFLGRVTSRPAKPARAGAQMLQRYMDCRPFGKTPTDRGNLAIAEPGEGPILLLLVLLL